jgi:hypothetical protein
MEIRILETFWNEEALALYSSHCLEIFQKLLEITPPDRLCGLVVRVPGYRSRGPGFTLGATRFPEKQ